MKFSHGKVLKEPAFEEFVVTLNFESITEARAFYALFNVPAVANIIEKLIDGESVKPFTGVASRLRAEMVTACPELRGAAAPEAEFNEIRNYLERAFRCKN